MNEYDSSKMADLLDATHGYQLTEVAEEADVLLLNTCSIREKAQEKVFHQLGRWKLLKRKNPDLIIGVGGCVASQEGDHIRQRAHYVDIIFGPQTLHRLPEMINRFAATVARSLTSASRKSKNSTVCRNRAPMARPPSSPSWKAATNTALTAWCLTPVVKKSAARRRYSV
jgi:tRNA A37 methylthiotransferase MiaB